MKTVASTKNKELEVVKNDYGNYDVHVNGYVKQWNLSADNLAEYLVYMIEGMHYISK